MVPSPTPILEERFNFASAFRVTPATGGISGGILALLAVLAGLPGVEVRARPPLRGSAVDAAYGRERRRRRARGGGAAARGARRRWSSCRPTDLRPGELGTLIDFEAGTARRHRHHHRPRRARLPQDRGGRRRSGTSSSTTGCSPSCPKEDDAAAATSARSTTASSSDGDEVKLSDLKNTFAERMTKVREQLMDDAMSKGWFTRKPGTVKVLCGPARHPRARRRGRAHRSSWRRRRTPRCSACR